MNNDVVDDDDGGAGKLEFPYLLLGYRSVQQSLWSSVATANKCDADNKKGEKITSQQSKASLEECDEAVEG